VTDRQDIDALLISALYGELTPADEARLAAHLDSHPADRGALDGLKSARAKVLESRIFELQAEPPQHISALLLQEAHRRAPKMVVAEDGEKQSWFWRFARSFMLHPAMAAAAMLVIVLGVGALMYKNKGADFAHKEVAAPAQNEPTLALESKSNGAAAGSAAAVQDPGYRAGLAEDNDLKAADQGATEGAADKKETDSASQRWRDGKDGDSGLAKAAAPARNENAIPVTTEQPQPKDFESDRPEERQAPSQVAQHAAANAEKAKTATKGAYAKGDSATLDFDGTSDDFGGQGTATGAGRAPGTGGGGATNGIVVGGLAAPSTPPATTTPSMPQTGHAYGPSAPSGGAVAGNRGYAQPPPPPPAPAPSNDKTVAKTTTATTTAPAAAPKQAPAKVAATPTAKPDAKPPTATTKAPAKNESVAKAGESKAPVSDQKKVATQPAPVAQTPPADSTLVGWAKSQHARAVALAKDGKCQAAAQVALGVSQKAPDYYASFMASDRQLKSCKQYIDDARDREAEKSAKSRAQKRVNADEAAPADSSLNK
jgi:hypothetical protein